MTREQKPSSYHQLRTREKTDQWKYLSYMYILCQDRSIWIAFEHKELYSVYELMYTFVPCVSDMYSSQPSLTVTLSVPLQWWTEGGTSGESRRRDVHINKLYSHGAAYRLSTWEQQGPQLAATWPHPIVWCNAWSIVPVLSFLVEWGGVGLMKIDTD